MKKILAVVLAVLMLSAMSCVVYAMNVRWYDPNCSHANTHIETYDYYYDCGEEIHKYVYGYNIVCSSCGYIVDWEDTYEDPDGSPHSYGEDGYCYCGRWDGVTETNPPA